MQILIDYRPLRCQGILMLAASFQLKIHKPHNWKFMASSSLVLLYPFLVLDPQKWKYLLQGLPSFSWSHFRSPQDTKFYFIQILCLLFFGLGKKFRYFDLFQKKYLTSPIHFSYQIS